jgi:hypothetical protein
MPVQEPFDIDRLEAEVHREFADAQASPGHGFQSLTGRGAGPVGGRGHKEPGRHRASVPVKTVSADQAESPPTDQEPARALRARRVVRARCGWSPSTGAGHRRPPAIRLSRGVQRVLDLPWSSTPATSQWPSVPAAPCHSPGRLGQQRRVSSRSFRPG